MYTYEWIWKGNYNAITAMYIYNENKKQEQILVFWYADTNLVKSILKSKSLALLNIRHPDDIAIQKLCRYILKYDLKEKV
jgi:hypothetical protein